MVGIFVVSYIVILWNYPLQYLRTEARPLTEPVPRYIHWVKYSLDSCNIVV